MTARDQERESLLGDSNATAQNNDHVVDMFDETTPLIETDLPAELIPDKRFRILVLAVGGAVLTIITISQIIIVPAMQQVMEDIICRKVHPDHRLNVFGAIDERCKDDTVTKILAMVRSWTTVTEMLVPMLVQVPYGIISDKYGRQPVLFFALLGCLFQQSWCVTVLMYPDSFSIWNTLYGGISYLIGGGGQMATSMVFTMLTDTTPAAERSVTFYYVSAVQKIIVVLATPLAAALLAIDPWVTLWIGYGCFVLGVIVTLFIPETLKLRQTADGTIGDGPDASQITMPSKLSPKSVISQALFSARNDVAHLWRFLVGSNSVMTLIMAAGFIYPVKIAFAGDFLQYLSKRFSWTWSKATYATSVENVASLITLMVLLPLAGKALARYGYTPLRKDVWLLRASAIILTVGCLMLALSPTVWLSMLALVVYSISAGAAPLVRSTLSAVIEPHTIGTVNTVLSAVECGVTLVAAPTLGWVLSKGLSLGGMWMGLELMVTAVLSAVATVFIFWFKLPSSMANA